MLETVFRNANAKWESYGWSTSRVTEEKRAGLLMRLNNCVRLGAWVPGAARR